MKMDNQQLNLLTREQSQVLLTARLGDGCISTSNTNSTFYSTNCKYKEYIDFKGALLGDLMKNQGSLINTGYKNPLFML